MLKPALLERFLPWLLRLAWVAVVVFGGAAVDAATDGREPALRTVAYGGGGGVWLIGVGAMAIPAVVSLTATRAIVPLAVPAAVVTWIAGSSAIDAVPFLGAAVFATVVAYAGELGRVFVQASAYGEEDRHPLRPPPAYAIAAGLTWAIWAACTLAGPLLLAARAWVFGGVVTAAAIAMTVWAWPRWHKLSRRWFVIVPAGLVVHDHLVLAETLMLRRNEITDLHLARVDTTAADLTGPAAGHAIEIGTTESVTAIFAATPSEPRGRTIHLTACLVAPTRPGSALAAAGRRRLPIG